MTGLLLSLKTQSTVFLTVSSEFSEIILRQKQKYVAAERQMVQRGDRRSTMKWRKEQSTHHEFSTQNGGTRKERQGVAEINSCSVFYTSSEVNAAPFRVLNLKKIRLGIEHQGVALCTCGLCLHVVDSRRAARTYGLRYARFLFCCRSLAIGPRVQRNVLLHLACHNMSVYEQMFAQTFTRMLTAAFTQT